MYCSKCGTQLEDTALFCSQCSQKTEYRAELEAKHPLAWFRFLIYFSLFASEFFAVLNAVMYITGSQYGDRVYIFYSTFPEMKISDCVFGVLWIFIAVYIIITRSRLAAFRRNAPAMLISVYVINFVMSVLYPLVSSFTSGQSFFNGTFIARIIYILIITVVMVVCNAIYFKKRKALFSN